MPNCSPAYGTISRSDGVSPAYNPVTPFVRNISTSATLKFGYTCSDHNPYNTIHVGCRGIGFFPCSILHGFYLFTDKSKKHLVATLESNKNIGPEILHNNQSKLPLQHEVKSCSLPSKVVDSSMYTLQVNHSKSKIQKDSEN